MKKCIALEAYNGFDDDFDERTARRGLESKESTSALLVGNEGGRGISTPTGTPTRISLIILIQRKSLSSMQNSVLTSGTHRKLRALIV